MKKLRKALCLILSISLALCVRAGASAVEPRASDYLRSYGAYCYPEDDGSVSVWFEVEGTGVEEVLGVLTIIIEEKASGGSWEHAATYTNFENPSFLSYNNDFHYGDIDFEDTTAGYAYRAQITFWGGGLEIGDSRNYTTAAVIAQTPSN